MCKALRLHDPRRAAPFRLGQLACPGRRRVAPGSTILFHCNDSSAGQLGPSSHGSRCRGARFRQDQPGLGADLRRGGRAGRRAEGDDRSFAPQVQDGSGWGWTANIPGFGLLADQFTDPALTIWKYDADTHGAGAVGQPAARLPLKPFAGTIGNALAEPGLHSVVPPRRVGGNLDIRDLADGHRRSTCRSRWRGRCSASGDTHAAQGDGEVCGTAIESPMDVVADAGPGEGRKPEDAALHHAGAGDAAPGRQGLRGDDRHRAGPDDRRARCGVGR